MAWSNFTHLTKHDTDRITISGTGKAQQSTARSDFLKPLAAESKAGG